MRRGAFVGAGLKAALEAGLEAALEAGILLLEFEIAAVAYPAARDSLKLFVREFVALAAGQLEEILGRLALLHLSALLIGQIVEILFEPLS